MLTSALKGTVGLHWAGSATRRSIHSNTRVKHIQPCRIGTSSFVSVGLKQQKCVSGAPVSRTGSASYGQRSRWQIVPSAGPPSLPEPESGAYVGVQESQISANELANSSASSNGAKQGSNGALGSGHLPATTSSTTQPAQAVEEPKQGGLAHRWRIVFMMALAFVLCNMDKVSRHGLVLSSMRDHSC